MPPVIIIGMHRSGTSLATWLLESCGLFTGVRNYPRTGENAFFVQLNSWVMRQCGVEWDGSDPIPSLLACPPAADLMTDALRAAMRSPRSARYWGLGRFFATRGGRWPDTPWGWKDPRSTLTLPLWLRLFPDAKVIHITRHGIDVAESLRSRWARHSLARIEHYHARLPLYVFSRKRIGVFSTRLADVRQGLELWCEYMAAAQTHLATLPTAQKMELRYEDLLADTPAQMTRLAEFCALPSDPARIQQAITANALRADRAYSYRSHPALVEIARASADRLSRYGYCAD